MNDLCYCWHSVRVPLCPPISPPISPLRLEIWDHWSTCTGNFRNSKDQDNSNTSNQNETKQKSQVQSPPTQTLFGLVTRSSPTKWRNDPQESFRGKHKINIAESILEPLYGYLRRNRRREDHRGKNGDLKIEATTWKLTKICVIKLFLNFRIWSHFTAILTTVSSVVNSHFRESTWCQYKAGNNKNSPVMM